MRQNFFFIISGYFFHKICKQRVRIPSLREHAKVRLIKKKFQGPNGNTGMGDQTNIDFTLSYVRTRPNTILRLF